VYAKDCDAVQSRDGGPPVPSTCTDSISDFDLPHCLLVLLDHGKEYVLCLFSKVIS